MEYYLISPRVDGKKKNKQAFLEQMFKENIVMMGWGPDNDLGKSFKEISHNDLILVAQRENWKFNYYFAGIVDGSSFLNDDGFQCLRIKHFVDLRNRNDDFLANVSFANAQTIKALMVIHDIEVINHLNIIIREKMEKEIIKKYCNLLKNNHNLILTGAPGTGKTYLAKQIAQQMIFGEIKEKMSPDEERQFNEQCGFVQFHPSYDYTDFVEGLRPKQDAGGNVGFERKDGVFKEFCKRALHSFFLFEVCYYELLQDIKKSGNYTLLQKRGNSTGPLQVNDKNEICWPQASKSEMIALTKVTLDNLKKLFAKYYTCKKASDMSKMNEEIRDLIGGVDSSYYWAVLNEVLHRMEDKKYVFIIDEINRGEISKIFGELFFSIDPGYRGTEGKVKTQYQNLIEKDDEFYEGFFVPDNVYIIGTMNDIDRSVESMDFAFRRRFAFKEIKAEENVGMLDDLEWKDEAISRMKNLNAAIEKVDGLSSAYHIGASYFLKLKNYKGDFGQLWNYHLEGLLREYLRGIQNIDEIIGKLKTAYNNESDNNNGQQQQEN